MRVGVVRLREVDRAGEEYDADHEEEDKETELTHTRADRLSEDLKASRVTRELEDPEDPDQADDSEDGEGHGLVVEACLVHCYLVVTSN